MSDRAIVVGGGLAGLSAACELLERGRSVTLLEKESQLGGNSSKATNGIAAPGSWLQATSGIIDTGAELIDGPAAEGLLKQGPKDVKWLTEALGIQDELVLRLTPGHGRQSRTIGTKTHFPGAVFTYAAVRVLQQVALVKPERLEIISSARVTNLLQQGSEVVGVEYARAGQTSRLMGAVVLCSGGFAGDKGMLSKYAPQCSGMPTANDERTSGDAITLGMRVGAVIEKMDDVQIFPTAAVLAGQEDSSFKIIVSDAVCGAGGKLLDCTGHRFCDELGEAPVRVDAMSKAKGPIRVVINAENAQEVEWLCNFYLSRGVMTKYSCASDLAKVMQLRSNALDAADLGSGEIYAAVVTPAVYSCAGGLSTGWFGETAGKVMSSTGPIVGLFAAGEATSAPFPKLWGTSGIPLLYSIFSGRAAGAAAAKGLAIKGSEQSLQQLVVSSLTSPDKVAGGQDQEIQQEIAKPLENLTKEELISKVKDLQASGPAVKDDGPTGITLDEVKKHNTKEDAWVIINGDVIDVTKWIPLHPGGEQAIVAYLGQDASDEWNMIHKPGTVEKNLVAPGGNGPIKLGPLGTGTPASCGGTAAPTGLTSDEISKHNKESDGWVVVNGKAYDVTKWMQVHPGGVQAIMAYAGKDATDEWNCIHKPGTIEKNLYPGNPNGPVDMGIVSGAAPSSAPLPVVDDEAPPPDGPGCMPGPIGAIIYLIKAIVVMLLKTVFFTGNLKFSLANNRKGTIRSACFLLTFTIIHVLGNFVGMLKGPNEANGEGYFFDRISWTGGFGLWKEGPFGLSVVEEYLALALLLHVSVALKRSWDISMNYGIHTGRWNMLLSGLTILTFLTVHLADLRFSSQMTYTSIRPPPYYVAWSGLLEGRVFFETDTSIPEVKVRDLYSREVALFKDTPKAVFYTVCICTFFIHMTLGWKKLVPADAMQIPKDHVKVVTLLGQLAAAAIVSMYLSVVWVTWYFPAQYVEPYHEQ